MSEFAARERQGDPVSEGDVCVVLIHGIGDIAAGAVVHSAESGIRRALPDVEVISRNRVDLPADAPTRSRAHIESLRLRWRTVGIEIIEFNWTGVAGKIRVRRPFQALWRVMETLREAPQLAISGDSSRFMRCIALLAGWYQWLLLGITALMLAGSVREIFAISNPVTTQTMIDTDFLWESGHFASATLFWCFYAAIWWIVITFGVLASTAFFWLAGILVRFDGYWTGIVLARTLFVSSLITLLGVWVGVLLQILMIQVSQQLHTGTFLPVKYFLFLLVMAPPLWLLLVLANLMRDVIHYLSAVPGGGPADGVALRRDLFHLLAGVFRRSPPPRVVLVSHSLGTVVLADLLLSEQSALPGNSTVVLDIVTAGSPIRRLINRMLPHRLPAAPELYRRLSSGSPMRVGRWFNIYRIFDCVGQALSYSALLPAVRSRGGRDADVIREHLLRPCLRWPFGHADYWGDRRFVSYLAVEVVAPLVAARSSGS